MSFHVSLQLALPSPTSKGVFIKVWDLHPSQRRFTFQHQLYKQIVAKINIIVCSNWVSGYWRSWERTQKSAFLLHPSFRSPLSILPRFKSGVSQLLAELSSDVNGWNEFALFDGSVYKPLEVRGRVWEKSIPTFVLSGSASGGKTCSTMNERLHWHPPQLGVEVEQKETPHFIDLESHYKGRKIFWLWLSKVSPQLKWSPRNLKLCWEIWEQPGEGHWSFFRLIISKLLH